MEAKYTQGETIAYELADANYNAVVFRIGTDSVSMTKTDGVWSASVSTDGMSGKYRFATFADGKVVEKGAVVVSVLVSKYRAVVDEIDAAIQSVSKDGCYSFSVEGVSHTNKTFDEMLKAREYYERLADAEENGSQSLSAPMRVSEVYA